MKNKKLLLVTAVICLALMVAATALCQRLRLPRRNRDRRLR